MEHFKKSAWPLILVLLFMFGISSCIASSFSTQKPSTQVTADNGSRMSPGKTLDQRKLKQASFPDLAANMLQRVINNKPIKKHLKILENVNPSTLKDALDTPRKRLTFWLDIYNGFTQYFLKKDPSLYKKNRSAYFDKNQIHIAGYVASFNDIEHGILRKGATIWSKGLIRIRAFRKDFIQKYMMNTVDFRIHFALNCGAQSCPPIVVYRKETVAAQLNDNTQFYLNKEVKYNKEKNVVKIPAFMKWFSVDFGGTDGSKLDILKEYHVIPQNAEPEVKYLSYDWTMKINNYKSYDE